MSNNPAPNSGYIDPNLLGDPTLYFQAYDTVKYGTSGNDTLNGDFQRNEIFGGAGNDHLSGFGGNDYLDGGANDDNLDGGDGKDTLIGGAGNDTLIGGADDDRLDGGAGNNYLMGGDGNDLLISGNGGPNHLNGGAGNDDVVDYTQSATGLTVHLDTGVVSNGDSISLIETVLGSSHNDTIYGTTGDNYIDAGAGNDNVYAQGGNDTMVGGAGNDTLDATGASTGGPGDTLMGDAGNDFLRGGDDNDVINGGSGDDWISDHGGNNQLTGGTGHDTFDFQMDDKPTGSLNVLDFIVDFNKSEDTLILYDAGSKATPITVGYGQSNDVTLTFSNHTVELYGVQNTGYHSVQDLTNAGFNIQHN